MAVEAISGAGMTYQGSSSTAEKSSEARSKLDAQGSAIASQEIADQTMALDTKGTGNQGKGDNGKSGYQNSEQGKNGNHIKKAVEEINKSASGSQSEAIFGIHDDTNRVTIKIVDKKTKEVIKEYPPEKTLDMIAKVWEMAGIMVDEKR